MATLDEMLELAIAEKKAQTKAGSATAGPGGAPPKISEFGRQVTREREHAPIHLDGVPIEQVKSRIQGKVNPKTALSIASALNARRAQEPDVKPESLLVTTPVGKTGDFAIDNRGKVKPSAGPLGMSAAEIMGKAETFPEDFEFDSEEALRLQRAEDGVDFRKGLPFFSRLQIATSSPIPRAKAERVLSVISDEIKKVPEGIAPLQYDSALGEFYMASQITDEDVEKGFEPVENVGKFRYVSLDGTGIEMADIADLMNLGEIGSIAGSVTGVAKAGKLIPFLKAGSTRQIGAAGFAGGSAGRLTGDGLSVLLDVVNSDGAFIPTREELADLGMGDVQTELLASLIGETLGLGLKKSSDIVQDAYAKMTGREGVHGSAVDVAEANVNINLTKEDLSRVKTVTGSEDLVITRGQSSGSIEMLELENSRLKNASPATKRAVEVQRAKSDRATGQFVENVFGGNLVAFKGRHGTITRANRAIEDGNLLVTSSQDGIIGIHPMVSPEHGLKIRPDGIDSWQIKGAMLPENLRGTGMGRDLYLTAADEARAHGAIIKSDDNVTEAAARVWRSIDGDERVGKLKWNPDAEFNETLKRWETLDGSPVVSMEPREPFLPKL